MARITLSFDNGPHPDVTPVVLDILAEYALKATFFVVGKNIVSDEGRALIAQAHARGHWIGNHTFHHAIPLGRIEDPDAARWEIARTDELIGALAHPGRLFRPYGQGGALDNRLLSGPAADFLCERGFTCVIWNAVPRDWVDPDGWVETALRQIGAQEESLLVLHDIASGAMTHLRRFLDRALSSGAQFRQEAPESCVLIAEGKPTPALESFVFRR